MRKINLKKMLDRPPFQGWEELYNSFAKEFNKAPDKLTYFSSIQTLNINTANKLERIESNYEKNLDRLFKTLDQVHIFTANGEHDFHFNDGVDASKKFINKLKKDLKYLLYWYQGESIPLPLKEIESESFKEYRENHPWAFDAIDEAHEAFEQIYELYNISDFGIQGEIRNCLANVVFPAYAIKSERILEQVSSEIYSQIRKKGFDNEIKPYDQLSEQEKEEIENRSRSDNTDKVGRPLKKGVKQADIKSFAKEKLCIKGSTKFDKKNKKFWHQKGPHEGKPIWNSLVTDYLDANKDLDITPRQLVERFKKAYEVIISS